MKMKKITSLALILGMIVQGAPVVYAETTETAPTPDSGDIVVLYTNDVHNGYEKGKDCLGYASVAWLKKNLQAKNIAVELVDNGDAIQGGVIGTLSKGEYLVDIMNKTGYTIAIPGNHEFDFGMDRFIELAKSHAQYKYVSCNFEDLTTQKSVFDSYEMKDYDGVKVAYVGISTPETFTKSTPTYFQDDKGNYIYGFYEGNNGKDLYDQVQKTVDEARAAGANYVVALAHTGIDEMSKPWNSYDVISNTSGIDAYLDGHSHSTIAGEKVKNKDGKDVILSSTGTKLASVGELVIDKVTGDIQTTLVTDIPEEDAETKEYVDSVTAKFNDLQNQVVAKSEIDLVVNDPVTGNRMVRSQETNLGDLCTDAYRTLLDADVAIVNGGGIRANIKAGDITYGNIVSVHPFGNAACLAEVTGQQILDALEHGSRAADSANGELGGFLQVSGMTYDIDTTIPTSVELNDKSEFVKVAGEYRVKNVKIGGKPLDLNKTYKLATHNYCVKSCGDGYTMFKGVKILRDEVLIDNQVLINYITNTLGGVISKDSAYADPYGQGRIRVITDETVNSSKTQLQTTYLKGFGETTDTFKPAAATFKSALSTKTTLTANWKKVSSANGYEIRYATNSKFKSAKKVKLTKNSSVTKKLSKLKANTKYYLQIRTYQNVNVNGNDTKLYSAWSKTKAVKTKKK